MVKEEEKCEGRDTHPIPAAKKVPALEQTQRIQDHVGAAAQHGRQLEGLVESGSEGVG